MMSLESQRLRLIPSLLNMWSTRKIPTLRCSQLRTCFTARGSPPAWLRWSSLNKWERNVPLRMPCRPPLTRPVSPFDAVWWRIRRSVSGPNAKTISSACRMSAWICYRAPLLSVRRITRRSMLTALRRLDSRKPRSRSAVSQRSSARESRFSERCTRLAKTSRSRDWRGISLRITLTSALPFTLPSLEMACRLTKKQTNMRCNQRLSQPIKASKSWPAPFPTRYLTRE